MRRKGKISSVMLFAILFAIGIFAMLILPVFFGSSEVSQTQDSLSDFLKRPENGVSIIFVPADPEHAILAKFWYQIPDGWGYSLINFSSDLDGNLLEGYYITSEYIVDKNDFLSISVSQSFFSPDSEIHNAEESWDVWCQRFEEVKEKVTMGFDFDAEDP